MLKKVKKEKLKKQSSKSFDLAFDRAMELALSAKPKDIKVESTLRLESDLYMWLTDKAKKIEISLESLMNDILQKEMHRDRKKTSPTKSRSKK